VITCARRLTSAGVIRDVFGINRHPCDRNRAPIASGTARPGEAGASEASLSEAPVVGAERQYWSGRVDSNHRPLGPEPSREPRKILSNSVTSAARLTITLPILAASTGRWPLPAASCPAS
jgi:hypothetical protein